MVDPAIRAVLWFGLALIGWLPSQAASPEFTRDVRPILAAKCYSCHGPDAEARKAGLRLDSFEGATAPLKSGGAAVVAGKPADSVVLSRVVHADPDERMPPKGEPLTPAEVRTLEQWIAAGAVYAEPWAFRALQDPPVPPVRDAQWCWGGIDAFVLAHRESAHLPAPARDVDPAALLRRLSYDLRGLPPSPDEVKSFLADPSREQFERRVDHYLADPAFGERWGRHWLDLARFAETMAHEFDFEIPHAWRYRDYVVEAFNADLPLSRFVAEQIAGDLMPPRPGLGLPNAAPLGTAWWFLGPATHAPVDVRQDEADRIAGAVDVAGRSFFGLSIACSRCHDHKFDPIPARDFYALAGVARNTRRIEGFLDADAQTPERAAAAVKALEEASRASGVSGALAGRRPPIPPGVTVLDEVARGGAGWSRSGHAFDASASSLALDAVGGLRPAEVGTLDSARLALPLAGSARSADFTIGKRYFHVRLRGSDAAFRAVVDNYWLDKHVGLLFEGYRRRLARAEGAEAQKDPRDTAWRIETFDFSRHLGERVHFEVQDDGPGWIEVDAILTSDSPAPPPADQWDGDGPARGFDPSSPGVAEARRRAVEARDALLACAPPIRALVADEGGTLDEPIHVRGAAHRYGEAAPLARLSILGASPQDPVEGSGRRALVAALTDPRRPFLWRTTANRLWLKLFGRGIVETPDDFGQLGGTPWSPELLDHLASRLSRGQTFKQLIRDLVLSHAYRSAAEPGETVAEAWSPLPVRRLDAEQIRDAMLAASGTLDRSAGGPSVPARLTEHMQGRGRPGKSGPVDGARRRSVYLETRRNFLDPFLQAFDQPAPATTCGRRHASNVPAQSLALMNSELVHLMAVRWAEKLLQDSTPDPVVAPDAQDPERIRTVWLSAFSRMPRPEEIRWAVEFLRTERTAVTGQEPSARERAAYAALIHSLFASKEFVFLR